MDIVSRHPCRRTFGIMRQLYFLLLQFIALSLCTTADPLGIVIWKEPPRTSTCRPSTRHSQSPMCSGNGSSRPTPISDNTNGAIVLARTWGERSLMFKQLWYVRHIRLVDRTAFASFLGDHPCGLVLDAACLEACFGSLGVAQMLELSPFAPCCLVGNQSQCW